MTVIVQHLEPDLKVLYARYAGNASAQLAILDVQEMRNEEYSLENEKQILILLRLLLGNDSNILTALHDLQAQVDELTKLVSSLLPGPAVSGEFLVEGELTMAFVLGDDQKVTANVVWKDAKGAVAQVDGPAVFASSDTNVATVTDNGDGSMTIVGGTPGACQITATADSDMTPGVTQVIATLDLSVVPGQAVSGDIVPGAPVAQ